MKRLFTVVLALALVALFAFSGAFAAEGKKEAKPQSWSGEVVDLGCYMGHGAKGEGHKECGLKCVANGMPMGLLVGGNKVYLLTMSHDNADPFNACKGMVGQQITCASFGRVGLGDRIVAAREWHRQGYDAGADGLFRALLTHPCTKAVHERRQGFLVELHVRHEHHRSSGRARLRTS